MAAVSLKSIAPLLVLMVATVAGVAALAYWDEQRESAAALDDFAQEQATLAASVANQLSGRLLHHPGAPPQELTNGVRRLERPNALVLLLSPPGGELWTADGRRVEVPSIASAMAQGRSTVRLLGPEAAPLGLPERMALAGLAHVDAGTGPPWTVAVVASASRERDRERWARARLVLATTLAAGLVVGFGGYALRRQRAKLELERELAVAEVVRERDDRLARLSRAATMLTLASGVAHEISTPLGVISGRAEQLLQRAGEDERARRAAQAILEQSQRVKDVIRGLLDLARGGGPALQDVEPRSVVSAAMGLVQHRFEKAGVRLAANVPADLAPVRCDPTLLEHALVNLLLNACDACTRGGLVQVSARREGGSLTFAVEDDGEGIAEVNAARAAEPFFTTKPRGRGTGLGLAVVSEIAKCHRGSFSIEPGAPHGTRARIRLPTIEGGAT